MWHARSLAAADGASRSSFGLVAPQGTRQEARRCVAGIPRSARSGASDRSRSADRQPERENRRAQDRGAGDSAGYGSAPESADHRRHVGVTARRGFMAGQDAQAAEAGGGSSQDGTHRLGAAEGAGTGSGCQEFPGIRRRLRCGMTSGMRAKGGLWDRINQLVAVCARKSDRSAYHHTGPQPVAALRYTTIREHMRRAKKCLHHRGRPYTHTRVCFMPACNPRGIHTSPNESTVSP